MEKIVTINLQFVTVSSLLFIGAAVTLSASMKTHKRTVIAICTLFTMLLSSMAHAAFLTVGIDTALTQTPNANGNADAAFNTWAAGLGIGTPDITAWTTNADRDAGLIPGTGGQLVMDTGSASNSPFGQAPAGMPFSSTIPVTRSYTGGTFSYTVTSVLYANNDPLTWHLSPPLGTNLLTLVEGTSPTLSGRHVPMIVESPASQAGATVSPDGRPIFGYDGGVNIDVTHLGVTSLTSSFQRKSGFVLSFSDPISAFGFFAADLESTLNGGGNLVATAFLFDSFMTLIDFQTITVDGNDREGFYGITRSTPDISHAMFIVGAQNGSPTASNARQNSYAFGGFTFIQAEIPEPRVYAAMAILALCIGWRERRRLLALINKKQTITA
jgi:hypothetical protein